MVAINRIQNLLLMDEKERESETTDTSTGGDRGTPSYSRSNNQEGAKKYFSGSVAAELLKNDDIIVRLENVSASWTHEHTHEQTNTDKHTTDNLTSADDEDHKKDHQLHLTDFSLDVLKGELVVVVGPVGCSKSTLIMALLGELLPIDGAVYVSSHKKESQEHVQESSRDDAGDAIAYCAQEPWIMSVSVCTCFVVNGSTALHFQL
jgi:ABC-type multidrug transport system fused ATPase/permease subunit